MVVVRLFGGLGNQMFQYAAARELARRHRTQVLVDLRWFNSQEVRAPDLFRLNVEARPAPDECLLHMPVGWTGAGRRSRLRVAVAARRRRWHLKVEREPGVFDPSLRSAPDNSQLVGYWQSEKYFGDEHDSLRKELTPSRATSGWVTSLTAEIAAAGGVSVHVRRGDYAEDPAAARAHGTCPPEYYRRALQLLDDELGRPTYFVFSDDPAWAMALLEHPRLRVGSAAHGGARPEEDLALMASCSAHVIANSSFSWWGAWLGRHPEKVVVAPARWFADPALRADDIVPEAWMRL